MSIRLHSWLVRRYPREFRTRFAESMERDFADLATEGGSTVRPILDTALGALKEHAMTTRPILERPLLMTLLALLSTVPLLVMNHVVVFRVDPVFSWIRPGQHTGPYEWAILWSLLGLVLVGAVVALLPLLRPRANGWWLASNLAIGGMLLAGFVLLSVALGHDMTCDAIASKTCD
ncbi:MAG: hypothetical protein QM711_03805 [Micropruina sp.]|uniref:hypothetical protein n=1 Tax=Micropruina sp. TaxID=2737536 RepID=UPI0039E48E94